MAAGLRGLVLAGGSSRRMGRDKGALVYHGEPQAVHAWRLLSDVCEHAYVSTGASQAGSAPYRELPLILDDGSVAGPAAGLAAAWRRHPQAAWLVLAVDMPRVDGALLRELIGARDPTAPATAFRGADGGAEPLCAIWEPAARDLLLRRIAAGDASPRRILHAHAATLVDASAPEKLRGVNSPAERDALLRELAGV